MQASRDRETSRLGDAIDKSTYSLDSKRKGRGVRYGLSATTAIALSESLRTHLTLHGVDTTSWLTTGTTVYFSVDSVNEGSPPHHW